MADITVTAAQVRPVGDWFFSFPCVAGEALSLGDVVIFNSSFQAVKADTDSAAGVTAQLGVVVGGASGIHHTAGTVASGEACSVLVQGYVYLGSSAGLTYNKPLFASGTAGKMADVAPVNYRFLGNPINATTLYFNPTAAAPGS